ncbi:hypothetical protein GCM10007094_43310 [Pseudovibrio japonicus]|uniref:Uncharacterized protein n=1 Tax=Pseudovibrio japonicus TaxID=366534 RepID=A0ABQ3EP98_9HYPH|nr:hypothetical protein GCM10007094_43310 [Pseudovibrio japonicus]
MVKENAHSFSLKEVPQDRRNRNKPGNGYEDVGQRTSVFGQGWDSSNGIHRQQE